MALTTVVKNLGELQKNQISVSTIKPTRGLLTLLKLDMCIEMGCFVHYLGSIDLYLK